eukprot:357961-Chlamydomonas_euryale.AAC.2
MPEWPPRVLCAACVMAITDAPCSPCNSCNVVLCAACVMATTCFSLKFVVWRPWTNLHAASGHWGRAVSGPKGRHWGRAVSGPKGQRSERWEGGLQRPADACCCADGLPMHVAVRMGCQCMLLCGWAANASQCCLPDAIPTPRHSESKDRVSQEGGRVETGWVGEGEEEAARLRPRLEQREVKRVTQFTRLMPQVLLLMSRRAPAHPHWGGMQAADTRPHWGRVQAAAWNVAQRPAAFNLHPPLQPSAPSITLSSPPQFNLQPPFPNIPSLLLLLSPFV